MDSGKRFGDRKLITWRSRAVVEGTSDTKKKIVKPMTVPVVRDNLEVKCMMNNDYSDGPILLLFHTYFVFSKKRKEINKKTLFFFVLISGVF